MTTSPNGLYERCILSALAACAAETATFPLDFAKTRLQLNHSANPEGLFKALFHIVRLQGPRTLYAGLTPALARHIPYTGFRVPAFEFLRSKYTSYTNSDTIPVAATLAFGFCAGGIGQLLAVPFDLLKVRQQAGAQYSGIYGAFRIIVRREGVLGLWKGSLPAVQRAALVNVGELSSYDAAKRAILRSGLFESDSIGVHVCSALCCGLLSSAVSTPADVIKSRLMAAGVMADKGSANAHGTRGHEHAPEYRGMLDCFCRTWKAEGLRGMFKGFLPTWARLGPWQLTFWVTYEWLRQVQGHMAF